MKATSARLTVGSLRELSTVGVVCGLAAAYAAAVLSASDILGRVGAAAGGGVGLMLTTVATVFILIALFVSAVVIGNGVDTVIAGRQQQLSLLRLIGASSNQLRTSLVRAVAVVSTIGAGCGLATGVIGAAVARTVLVQNGTLPDMHYATVPPTAVIAGFAVIVTAVASTYVGAHRTLSAAAAHRPIRMQASRIRSTIATLVLVVGGAVLVAACYLGENGSVAGFFAAFLGAATVSVGILIGARHIVPGLVAVCGRILGSGPAAVLARKNAVSDPLRTTRSTLGLLIGVTLITTITAGMSSLTTSVDGWGLSPDQRADAEQVLSITTTVLIALVAISAVIAAVGFVSTMSLTVIGRTREIGMVRAMGFTARQVRMMIVGESLALSGTAVVAGLTLGIVFGAVGSQSLIGAMTDGMPIGIPLPALGAIIAGTAILVGIAALPPSRRATAVAPVDALAVT